MKTILCLLLSSLPLAAQTTAQEKADFKRYVQSLNHPGKSQRTDAQRQSDQLDAMQRQMLADQRALETKMRDLEFQRQRDAATARQLQMQADFQRSNGR